MIRKIRRQCASCGKHITVQLQGKKPLNAYYFGRMKLPVGKGKWVIISSGKKIMMGKVEIKKARWTGREREVEYWECEKCYESAGKEINKRERRKKKRVR